MKVYNEVTPTSRNRHYITSRFIQRCDVLCLLGSSLNVHHNFYTPFSREVCINTGKSFELLSSCL